MQANYVQRLRLTFSKNGPARYIGHLDLARTMERAFNRAKLPVSYSQGFNQRPRLAFAAALPLGYTSEYELADVWLVEHVDPATAVTQIMSKMAPGITITAAETAPLKGPSLQSITAYAHYSATPLDVYDEQDLELSASQLLAEASVVRELRKGKSKAKRYDLRPLIVELAVDSDAHGRAMLRMVLSLMSGKSGRPDEVLAALGVDPLAAHIHRTLIILADEEQRQLD
jgi:radical SAM-linked protein